MTVGYSRNSDGPRDREYLTISRKRGFDHIVKLNVAEVTANHYRFSPDAARSSGNCASVPSAPTAGGSLTSTNPSGSVVLIVLKRWSVCGGLTFARGPTNTTSAAFLRDRRAPLMRRSTIERSATIPTHTGTSSHCTAEQLVQALESREASTVATRWRARTRGRCASDRDGCPPFRNSPAQANQDQSARVLPAVEISSRNHIAHEVAYLWTERELVSNGRN